jgi:zinc transport system substrate-binding protein
MKIVLMSIWTWPALACSVALLAACGSSATGTAAPGGSGDEAGSHRLRLVTSFYPLQFATARIAENLAEVSSLTKPGAEPHDLELSPRDVARIADADLVVYLSGFQPAVDDAVRNEARHTALDVAPAARLDLKGVAEGPGRAGRRTAVDPHFWLDPTRLSAVAQLITDRLARLDPADASTFRANGQALHADLAALDAEFSTGLASCANRDIVTSHQAFGYLAQRYHMTQVGITGLTPEEEPDPATLARVADFVRVNGVRTIYYETLVSPAIARTVAGETGARTAVLDPIEGITTASPGRDYLEVMRADLAALEAGQPCP